MSRHDATTGQHQDGQADSLRYVFIQRIVAQCPACSSTELKTLRSKNQGDGSTARRTLCKSCGHRFFIIVE